MHGPTRQPHSRVHGQWHWVLWRLSVSDLFIYFFNAYETELTEEFLRLNIILLHSCNGRILTWMQPVNLCVQYQGEWFVHLWLPVWQLLHSFPFLFFFGRKRVVTVAVTGRSILGYPAKRWSLEKLPSFGQQCEWISVVMKSFILLESICNSCIVGKET